MRQSALIVAVVLLAAPAHAGIVNVQSILASDAPEGVSGSVTASADWRTGNTKLLLLSAEPVARIRSGDHLVIGLLKGQYAESNDSKIISKTFEHLRYRYTITDTLLGEVFAQHEYDEFRDLELRALIGAGPKFDLISCKKFQLGVGVAYMLEFERVQSTNEEELQHRASSYALSRWIIREGVEFDETLYLQPRLTDLNDTRVLSQSSLVVKLTDSVAVSTSLNLAYDAVPPTDGINKWDTALKSSITIGF